VANKQPSGRRRRQRDRTLYGFDISSELIGMLQNFSKPNLSFHRADACDPKAWRDYAGLFTKCYSSDTLEHVQDPEGFFRTVAMILRVGGRLVVTFPNKAGHGVTSFNSKRDIVRLLCNSSLALEEMTVIVWTRSLSMFRNVFVEWPLAAFRLIRHLRIGKELGSDALEFQDTRCFSLLRNGRRPWHGLVNMYWALVAFVEERLFVKAYEKKQEERAIIGRRLLIVAKKI